MRIFIAAIAVLWTVACASAFAGTTETIFLRGCPQTLHLYGTRAGQPIIVSSGDGGWVHLGPHVAEALAEQGFFVVGFNVKRYLEGFTDANGTLRAEDVPGDFQTLLDFAGRPSTAPGTGPSTALGAGPSTALGTGGSTAKPVLIGVSEGAGLSVLAATDPHTRARVAGVVALGLPDLNELGWRWTDSAICLTHRVPDEPTFSAAAIVGRLSPAPLAMIHSTHDEFVPVADAERLFASARDPKRLWIINAANHRFSDNTVELDARLVEAVRWINEHAQG
jgi:Bacterial virulence protein (VirJ)